MNTRTVARLTFANPTSAVYLTVVGGSIVVASAVTRLAEDPGLIWVWPALFTAPASGLVTVVDIWLDPMLDTRASVAFNTAGMVASGLFQSFALGLLQQSVRTRLRGRFRPHPA
ncbi:SCO4225 family membrane protein [Streptomyces sp. NPDC055210]